MLYSSIFLTRGLVSGLPLSPFQWVSKAGMRRALAMAATWAEADGDEGPKNAVRLE